jgi:hypothetical protein
MLYEKTINILEKTFFSNNTHIIPLFMDYTGWPHLLFTFQSDSYYAFTNINTFYTFYVN